MLFPIKYSTDKVYQIKLESESTKRSSLSSFWFYILVADYNFLEKMIEVKAAWSAKVLFFLAHVSGKVYAKFLTVFLHLFQGRRDSWFFPQFLRWPVLIYFDEINIDW